MSNAATYQPSLYQRRNEQLRVGRKMANAMQAEDERTDVLADLHDQRNALLKQGVMPGMLPDIHHSMSPADLATAQAKLNELHGMSPTEARQFQQQTPAAPAQKPVTRSMTFAQLQGRAPMTPAGSDVANVQAGNIAPGVAAVQKGTIAPNLAAYQAKNGAPAVGERTGQPLPKPAGASSSSGNVAPLDKLPNVNILSGTAAPDADQRALLRASAAYHDAQSRPAAVSIPGGDPAARAFNGRTSTPEPGVAPSSGGAPLDGIDRLVSARTEAQRQEAARVAAAAGTGQAVSTQYGTASSSMAKPGAPLPPAVVSDTGVQHDPNAWHYPITKRFPELKTEGTAEHTAFVSKYNNLLAWKNADPANRSFDPMKVAESVYAERDKGSPAPLNGQGTTDPAVASKMDFLNRRMAKAGENQNVPQPPPVSPSYNDSPVTAAAKGISGALTPAFAGTAVTPDANPTSPGEASAIHQRNVQQLANTPSDDAENDAWMKAQAAPTPPATGVAAGAGAPMSTPATPTPPLSTTSTPGVGAGTPQTAPALAGFDKPDVHLPVPKNTFSMDTGFSSPKPDGSTTAFAKNPEEDEFQKKLKTPSYAGVGGY